MRKQISNTNMLGSKILIIGVFVLLFVVASFFKSIFRSSSTNDNNFLLNPFLLIVPFLAFYYLFIGRFYRVEIDDKTLYFYGLLSSGQIPLKNLYAVKPEFFDQRSFLTKSFGITIRYYNENSQRRKLKFLSKEIGILDSPEEIIELNELRSIISKNLSK